MYGYKRTYRRPSYVQHKVAKYDGKEYVVGVFRRDGKFTEFAVIKELFDRDERVIFGEPDENRGFFDALFKEPDLSGQVNSKDTLERVSLSDSDSKYLNEQRERAAYITEHVITPIKEFPKFIGMLVGIQLILWLFSI